MSALGGPTQAGLAGAAGSQDHVGQARTKKLRKESEGTRRFEDALDLRIAGVEAAEAIHGLEEEEHPDNRRRKGHGEHRLLNSKNEDDEHLNEDGIGENIDVTG